jgi:hypothetical protein
VLPWAGWRTACVAKQASRLPDKPLVSSLIRACSFPVTGLIDCLIPRVVRRAFGRAKPIETAADALRIGKSTAARALAALEERGFVVATRKGHFDRKVKHASEWRLTEYVCDVSGELPTKEFMRWQPVPATHSHKPVPVVGLAAPVVGPIGTRSGTVTSENIRFGT